MKQGFHAAGALARLKRNGLCAVFVPLLLLAGLAVAAPARPALKRASATLAPQASAPRLAAVPQAAPLALGAPTGAAAASPTGRTPRLLWTPQQQAVWNRMRAENNIWWQLLKSNADRSATPERRAGDMGVWGTMAYQVTGDVTYARKAWTMLTTGASKGGSYLDPNFTPVDGRNFTREAFVDFVWMYDWLYPALSPQERQLFIAQLNRLGDLVLNKVPGATWGTRLTDSDETVGHYFGLAFLDLATGPENPRAGTFLSSAWSEDSTNSTLRVGGLAATAGNLTSTMRNAIRRYVELSEGGQWIESSEYNMNTMRILLWGARGVQTATGVDYFPEVTRFAPQLAVAQVHEVTPDLADSYQWGDVQQPRNIEIWLRANLTGTLSGLLQNDPSTGPYVQQLTEELVGRYPSVASVSGSMPASFFLFFNPYASRADWRGATRNGHFASGYGFQFFHDGWGASDSFFGANFPLAPSVDHGLAYHNTFQLYRKGEWAITHPLGYVRNQGEYVNSMLIGGLSAAYEAKGPVAQEFCGNDQYAYIAGACGGQYYRQPYYNPPPTFLHEWTRSLFYLPSADKASDTLIVFDRTNADNPKNLPATDRYLASDRERILAAPANKQWIIHSPVAPTVTADAVSWRTKGGQQVRVNTLLPAKQNRAVLDEAQLFGSLLAEGERGFQTRIAPASEQRWDTFLNVVQASDNGAVLRNTLVRSAAGEAEGVRVERGGHNDALVLFSATPSNRILRYGYSVSWTAATARTEAFFLDLDPTVIWQASLNGGTLVPMTVSGQGVGRLVLPGAGAQTLTLRSSAPEDRNPPATPAGVTADPSLAACTVSWNANTESDLAGYHVLRGESQDGPYVVQNSSIVVEPRFAQSGLQNGTAYWFRVCAVDTSGNQSVMSQPVKVIPGIPTYTISGVVIQEGAPVANVTVSAGDYSAVTTSTGSYAISGVPSGTYSVAASRTGFAFSAPRTVTLAPNAANVDFAAAGTDGMKVDAGGNGYDSASSGRWLSERYYTGGAKYTYAARPINGSTDDPLYFSVRYGKSFNYQLPATPGDYNLKLHFAECWFTTAGSRRFNVAVNGATVLSNFDIVAAGGANTAVVKSFPVTVGAGGVTVAFQDVLNDALVNAIELEPIRYFAISGRVTVAGGTAEGVAISAGGKSAVTSADGAYSISGLSAGTYAVSAAKSEYVFSAPRSVTVGPDQAGVDFTGVQNTYSISGRVTTGGLGLSAATVTIGGRSVTTAADGSYSISGLVAGAYTVSASAVEYSLSAAQTVSVGPSRASVDFTATRKTYRITGAASVKGAALAGVAITAGDRRATTNSDGSYTLDGLISGTYTVTAGLAEHTFNAPISVTVGPDQAGVNFSGTQNTYEVSGTVRDGASGISGVTVTAGGRSVSTGADGGYVIDGLAAGGYSVSCSKRGYAFDAAQSVTVGPSRTGVDFSRRPVISPASFRLSDGKPAAGGSVMDVELSANGARVTAAAFDLAFDPTLVAFVGAQAGGLPAGTSVQANDLGAGRVRIVIFGGQSVWSSGRVASVTLRPAAGATSDQITAQVRLTLPGSDVNGVQVSDADGLSANASASGGTVTFLAGERGDLNRNGVPDIGDVQALLNVVLGLAAYNPAEHDLNDNGGIDIGDVQSLVNRLLNGGSETSAPSTAARKAKAAGKRTVSRFGLNTGSARVTGIAFDLDLAGNSLEAITCSLRRGDLQFSHRSLANGRERVVLYSTNGTPIPSGKNLWTVRALGARKVKALRPGAGAAGGDGALADGSLVGVAIPAAK